MSNNIKIGKIVAGWIDDKNKKRKDIAAILNISAPSLSQMLHGTIPVPKQHLYTLIEVLKPSQGEIDKVDSLIIGKKSLYDNRLQHDIAMELFDIPPSLKRAIKVYQNLSENKKREADGIFSKILSQLTDLL